MAPATAVRPVYVVGAGRSGTTLLVNLLGLHSSLEPIFETGFAAVWLRAMRDARAGPLSPADAGRLRQALRQWAEDLGQRDLSDTPMPPLPYGKVHLRFTAAEVLHTADRVISSMAAASDRDGFARAIREGLHELFALQASRAGKPGWVNKTPSYVEYLPELVAVDPDALVVHLIRDGRDVACSLLAARWGIGSVREAAARWRDQVEAGLDHAARHPGAVLEVRYERLVRSPRDELAGVCRVAGLRDESEEILGAFREGGFTIDAGERWRTTLTSDELDLLDGLIGPTLVRAGYDLARAGHDELAALRAKARQLDEIYPELQALRAQAHEFGEAKRRLLSLRFKAEKYDELVEELPALRYKARRVDELLAELEELRRSAGRAKDPGSGAGSSD